MFLEHFASSLNAQTARVHYHFRLKPAFSDNLAFFRSKVDQKFTSPTALLADNRTLQRGSFFDSQGSTSTNTYTMDTYVVGKFKTGSIQHQLVTGFDLFRQTDFTPDALNRASLDIAMNFTRQSLQTLNQVREAARHYPSEPLLFQRHIPGSF